MHRHLPNTLRVGIQDSQLNVGKRATYGIGAKRFEVVQGKRGASLGQTVSVRDRNSEIVEELERGRLDERATRKEGQQLSTKRLVNLAEQFSAELDVGPTHCQFF